MYIGVGFCTLFLLTTHVTSQKILPDQNKTTPDLIPPPCPDLICTLEFIPEECRETPVLNVNGVTCSGCQQWKASCKDGVTPVQNERPVSCPQIMCQKPDFPKECEMVETFDYRGIKCEKCPVKRPGCIGSVQLNRRKPEIACPLLRCDPNKSIPKECKEIPTYIFMGKNCTRCPEWRQGCAASKPAEELTKTEPTRALPEIACPLMRCDASIPAECKVEQEYRTASGRVCVRCPTWREGCQEQERIATNNGLHVEVVPNQGSNIPCPFVRCSNNFIPAACRQEQPYTFNGKTCFRCPKWRPECQEDRRPNFQRREPEIACPLVACDLPDLPRRCFRDDMYEFQGKMCRNCPKVREECQTLVQPRPVAVLDQQWNAPTTERLGCPLQGCPFIYIPEECKEMETFEFQGRICQGCPKYRPGCLPMGAIPQQPKPTTLPQIPQIPRIPSGNPVVCPEIGCPYINIPEECREQPTYTYKGITCNHCPRWREGCTPKPILNTEQEMAPECPMFRCKGVDPSIPKDCIEIPTLSIRGRNCTTCPRYIPGCAADRPIADVDRMGPKPSEIPIVSVACPLVPCTKILIPKECREERPYQFNGKTCFNCPVWREGCRKVITNLNDKTPTATKTTEATPVDKIECPLMACNRMYIPPECREVESYLFMNVKTCYKCQKWRQGCIPGDNTRDIINIDALSLNKNENNNNNKNTNTSPSTNTDNVNKNTEKTNFGNDAISRPNIPEPGSNSISNLKGVLPVDRFMDVMNRASCPPLPCPAVYIPPHCQQTQNYIYEGRLCSGCPTWRFGCSALNERWHNSNFDGLLAYSLFRELAGFNV